MQLSREEYLPDRGVVFDPYFELLITGFLTALSASAMGIFVSSLFKNAGLVLRNISKERVA